MYKTHAILLFIAGASSLILSYLYDFSYSEEGSSTIIMVLSIFFGFYVTSVSLVLSGRFIIELHNTVDKTGNKRLSQRLRDYYAYGLTFLLINISLFLIVSLFFASSENIYSESIDMTFSFSKWFSSLSTGFLVINLIFAFIQTKIFIMILTNEPYVAEKE